MAMMHEHTSLPSLQNRALAQLMAETPNISYIKDAEGRFFFVNDEFQHTLHKQERNVLGKTDTDIFARSYADQYCAEDQEVLDTGKVLEFTEQGVDPNGERHEYVSMKFPVVSTSGETLVGGICVDEVNHSEVEHTRKLLHRILKI